MKLKDKLCDEYILLPHSMRTELEKAVAMGWMAGFETSREMAENEANETAVDMDYEGDLSCREREHKALDEQYNMACYEIALKMKNLGEGEGE